MQQFVFSPISLDELQKFIHQAAYEGAVEGYNAAAKGELKEKLLSIDECRKLFTPAVSPNTIKNWTKDGILTDYRIGNKRYYKYAEVIEAAKSRKKYERRVKA